MTICRQALAVLLVISGTAIAQHSGHSGSKNFIVDGPRPDFLSSSNLQAPDGRSLGSIALIEGKHGLLIQIRIEVGSGISPGYHGLHLHAAGTCDGKDGFKSAGAHLGQEDAPHGLLAGGHAGDLPNIGIAADGSGLAEVHAPMVFVTAKKKRMPKGHYPLYDADGTALILHAAMDDHWSQPIGNAGGRIGCAVLRKP